MWEEVVETYNEIAEDDLPQESNYFDNLDNDKA